MGVSVPAPTRETTVLREVYATLNRNDVPALMRLFDPQVERIEPADFPGGGIHHGLEALQEHVSLHRGNWAEGGCEPKDFLAVGGRIIVLVDVHVRLRHESDWRDGRVADVFTFRDGRIIHWRTFFDERQAFAWAGTSTSGAG